MLWNKVVSNGLVNYTGVFGAFKPDGICLESAEMSRECRNAGGGYTPAHIYLHAHTNKLTRMYTTSVSVCTYIHTHTLYIHICTYVYIYIYIFMYVSIPV